MRNLFKAAALTAAGAAAMYYLDPDRGHRRRALVRDRLELVSHDAGDYARLKSRLAAHRVKALAASARASLSRAPEIFDDDSLAARARARFDRLMASPGPLDRMSDAMTRMTPTTPTTRGGVLGSLLTVVALCAASTAAMYYFDPELGRRRRALVRDKLDALRHDAGDFARAKGKQAADRAKGLVASVRAPLNGKAPSDDDQRLREGIRAQMDRLVTHPRAVEVEVTQGQVRLSGQILARDVQPLLSALSAMPGVHGVDNQLSVHDHADSLPDMQGGDGSQHAGTQTLASRTRKMLPFVAMAAPLAVMMEAKRRNRLAKEMHNTVH